MGLVVELGSPVVGVKAVVDPEVEVGAAAPELAEFVPVTVSNNLIGCNAEAIFLIPFVKV